MRKLWPGLVASLVATGFGLWALPSLPMEVASHWDMQGMVNGNMPRLWLVLLIPILALAISGVLVIAPGLDPRRRNFPMHAGAYWTVANTVLVFLAAAHVLVIGYNLGWPVHVERAMMPMLGILLMVIGNVLTRVRPNWIFGIRTPWTLSSEVAWRESHRVGGYGFVGTGALVLVATLLVPQYALQMMIAGVVASSVAAVGWSYFAWKRDPHAEGNTP